MAEFVKPKKITLKKPEPDAATGKRDWQAFFKAMSDKELLHYVAASASNGMMLFSKVMGQELLNRKSIVAK